MPGLRSCSQPRPVCKPAGAKHRAPNALDHVPRVPRARACACPPREPDTGRARGLAEKTTEPLQTRPHSRGSSAAASPDPELARPLGASCFHRSSSKRDSNARLDQAASRMGLYRNRATGGSSRRARSAHARCRTQHMHMPSGKAKGSEPSQLMPPPVAIEGGAGESIHRTSQARP